MKSDCFFVSRFTLVFNCISCCYMMLNVLYILLVLVFLVPDMAAIFLFTVHHRLQVKIKDFKKEKTINQTLSQVYTLNPGLIH